MKNNAPRFGKLRRGTGYLIVLLVALNLAMMVIRLLAHPGENFWSQLWLYFESSAFKVVTASLILPILLFLLESRFKIVEGIEKSRLERVRREREQRREKRLETITSTLHMWNQLYDLASQVRYFRKDIDGDKGVQDILRRIANFSSTAEDVVNMWYFRLNVSEENQELFLVFVNTLMGVTKAVVCRIRESDPADEECLDLQESLGVIQRGIKTMAHHPILTYLTHSMKLMELEEDRASTNNEEDIRSTIQAQLKTLYNWANALKKREIEHEQILPHIKSSEADDFRVEAKGSRVWMHDHPGQRIDKSPNFKSYKDLFYNIPREELLCARNIPYSKEFIQDLAHWLGFQSTCQDVTEMARWPK